MACCVLLERDLRGQAPLGKSLASIRRLFLFASKKKLICLGVRVRMPFC